MSRIENSDFMRTDWLTLVTGLGRTGNKAPGTRRTWIRAPAEPSFLGSGVKLSMFVKSDSRTPEVRWCQLHNKLNNSFYTSSLNLDFL